MIDRVWSVAETRQSKPFCYATEKLGLHARGYREKEYFFRGSSNVYRRCNGKRTVLASDAPYTNRMLVRVPADFGAASGNVVVELLNASAFIDLDRCFLLIADQLMSNGDIYVGITSKPCVLPALLRYDIERYEALTWRNPISCIADPETLGNMPGASVLETEDGLIWDMISDVGALLSSKRADNPLAGYPCKRKILCGWSQSGGYMVRYLRDFGSESETAFDGFFSCGPATSATPRLNQSDVLDPIDCVWRLPEMNRKMIVMHTESENARFGNAAFRKPDSELFRSYDVAGASHDTRRVMDDYYKCDPLVWKCGIIPNYRGREPFQNDFPMEFAFSAAYASLCAWIDKEIEPVSVAKIAYDGELNNVRDDSGNCAGGWRLPQIELPTAVYYDWCTPLKPDFALGCRLYGHKKPYGAERLRKRYGTLTNYVSLVEELAERCVGKRLLLPRQRSACVALAEQSARACWV